MNFANGTREHVGGGYKNGAEAQEEDLCRRIPTLYTSLNNGLRANLYPFGPSTCKRRESPNQYSDVLYTDGLVLARHNVGEGYELLPKDQQVLCALVTAAAPNIKSGEVYDDELVYRAIQNVFITPYAM